MRDQTETESTPLLASRTEVESKTGGPKKLSSMELTNLMETFAIQDKDEDKSWMRLFVEKWLEKSRWYFPGKDVPNAPSLREGWAFFEHITLPRYLWKSADHVFLLADPGDTAKTALYNPITMPQSCFLEFGLGVDQYFSSLLILSIMCLIASLINIPNMIYYASASYSGEGGKSHLPWALQVSAICTKKGWVVCQDCTEEEWSWNEEKSSFGTAQDGTILVERNECGGSRSMLLEAAGDATTFLFILAFIFIFSVYMYARETRFDEDRLDASDYSLKVCNPPSDAKDPDEWREFFSQFAEKQVTMVTVALDNEIMLEKLLERRAQVSKIRSFLPGHVDLDDEAMVRAALSKIIADRQNANLSCIARLEETILRSLGFLIDAEQSRQKLEQLTLEIKELQKKTYSVSAVFVSFETEEGQRRALSALAPSPAPPLFHSLGTKSKEMPTFRGTTLIVDRAPEPSSVHWLNLSTPRRQAAITMTINLAITFCAVLVAAYCENWTRKEVGPLYAGYLVSFFNSGIPYLVEALMYYEHHQTEDMWQISYFTKITLFRWVNTAILVKVFAPLTSNLDDDSNDVLPSMHYILISELLLTPLLRLSDMSGNFKRHFIAPRAPTQQEMNLNFVGTTYRLGERFTAMTNVIFVCFFYSDIFPAVYLFGFAILLVQYYTDKYCIVRIWKRAPAIGANLSRICRRYFLSAAMVTFICSSAFAWAQFPFDNLCDKVGDTEHVQQKNFNNVLLLDGSSVNVTVSQESPVYFCSQDPQESHTTFFFPPTPRIQPDGYKWMPKVQEEVCQVFGWTALFAVIGYIFFFVMEIQTYLIYIFWHQSSYQPPEAKSQQIDFSCNSRIVSYIPVIKQDTLAYPLIACNVDGIDKGLIGWHDPKSPYDSHNIIFDVPYSGLHRSKTHVHDRNETGCNREVNQSLHLLSSELPPKTQIALSQVETEPIYSIVKHYPPPWQRKLRLEHAMVEHAEPQSWAPQQPLC